MVMLHFTIQWLLVWLYWWQFDNYRFFFSGDEKNFLYKMSGVCSLLSGNSCDHEPLGVIYVASLPVATHSVFDQSYSEGRTLTTPMHTIHTCTSTTLNRTYSFDPQQLYMWQVLMIW